MTAPCFNYFARSVLQVGRRPAAASPRRGAQEFSPGGNRRGGEFALSKSEGPRGETSYQGKGGAERATPDLRVTAEYGADRVLGGRGTF